MSDDVALPQAGLFLDRLRFALANVLAVDLAILAEKSPACRTDALLELGADLSDTLVLYAQHVVNETVVREAAVAVAAEAVKVWISTVQVEHE